MEFTAYELINQGVDPSVIQQEYFGNDKIYYSLEKTSEGAEVCFYNPEFAFEKQHLENADAAKLFSYLKIKEKHPHQYERYLQKGFLYIRMDVAYLSSFVMHIFK